MKHTRETCFKLHGYPEWWHELKTKKKCEARENTSQAAFVSIEPQLSLIQQGDSLAENKSKTPNDLSNSGSHDWIIDLGATNHMTFDPKDFVESTQSKRTYIANANGVKYLVTGDEKVALSSVFSLNNTLLVPSLSNKLLSVGQATEGLNCCALMYPSFCLFQDILTKEVIGRGTKREGLYFMDDFNFAIANTEIQTSDKERQVWLWHRRLGHPSFRHLKHLFPSLFSNLHDSNFRCETCIQAKSHRVL